MKRLRNRGGLALSLVLLLLLPGLASAAAPPQGNLQRVSVTSDGVGANAKSESPVMSADGRYVVFESNATNLAPADTNNASDIFVHDRFTGVTRRASENAEGVGGTSHSYAGSISGNGRYVVFYSFSGNLVPEDTNQRTDVFRKDLQTGAIELVSLGANGESANGSSILSEGATPVSHDGRFIAYASLATNVVPGTPAIERGNHIFLRDMEAGTNELISQSSDGVPGASSSQTPSVSGDGNVVVFESRSVFDPRDENTVMDVWARDRSVGKTEWVSVNDHGHSTNDSSWRGRPSFDGRYVVFDSSATNLVPRDQGSRTPDVFVRDLVANRTEKVSVSSTGEPPNDVAYRGSISGDGRFIAFWSGATNFAAGKPNLAGDVWLRDRLLGTTELLSRTNEGGFGNNTSQLPALSADGASVAFMSWATNLVSGTDDNGTNDIFARTFGPSVGFIAGVEAAVLEDSVVISGSPRATGAVLSEDEDAFGDITPANATTFVGDITGVSAVYRAAENDVRFNVRFDDLPTPSYEAQDGTWIRPGVAAPGATYGVSFEVAGVRHEIRMNSAEDAVRYPAFDLFRCAPVCIPLGSTPGSYGTTGDEIDFTASLDALGATAGDELTDLRAFAGMGAAQTGGVFVDETTIPDTALPSVTSAVGVSPAGSDISAVEFSNADAAPILQETLPLADLAPGDYEAWARHCLGQECGYSKSAFTIGGGGTEVEQTVMTLSLAQDKGAVIARATLLDASGSPIAGREVNFTLNGQPISTTLTGVDGGASVALHRNSIKKDDLVGVSFAGDSSYSASSASAVMPAGQPDP